MYHVDAFTTYLTEKGSSVNTISAYRSDVLSFVQYCTKANIEGLREIDEACINDFFEKLRSEGRSQTTQKRFRSSLNQYFIFLQKIGALMENPIRGFLFKTETHERPADILSHEEVERLLMLDYGTDEKGIRDQAIVEVLYASGIKISGLIELKVKDYDPRRKVLYAEGRHVPLYASAHRSLQNYLDSARPYLAANTEHAMFVNMQGKPMTRQGLWKLLGSIAEKAGLEKKLTPQMLRRSFAVHLLENGASAKDLEILLGLRDPASAAAYLKLLEGSKEVETYMRFHPRARKKR